MIWAAATVLRSCRGASGSSGGPCCPRAASGSGWFLCCTPCSAPLLVLIPALADLARLALITAIGIAVLWICRTAPEESDSQTGLPISGGGGGSPSPCWCTRQPPRLESGAGRPSMKAADAAPERRRKKEYGQYRRRAALKAVVGALAGTAVFVQFTFALWQERTAAWLVLLLALIALVPLTYSWAGTLPGTAHRKGTGRTTTFLLTALALVLAVPLLPVISDFTFPL